MVVGELQAEGFPWLTRVASEAQLSVSPDGALDFVCLRAVISNALADLIDVIQGPLLCAWVNYLALRSVVVELQAEALLRYPGVESRVSEAQLPYFYAPPPRVAGSGARGGRLLVEHKDLRVLGED